ncbi:MAG: phosphoesterase [Candidatus Lokiarchaeota archaeon]|nr:phosphoesterase [Candidatus Lokiarchaeota archaeon]MBD3342392.1 phosphoesterase [Candidatus Lokiarchaeota archaeon]
MLSTMKILYITDLHGSKWKYKRSIELAESLKVKAIINGGDMFTVTPTLFKQDEFIKTFLNDYFSNLNEKKIYHLGYPGNDDLMIFDDLFGEICKKYPYVYNLAQKKVKLKNFEFIGMNWVLDYPFRLKDRCRIDTEDYKFQAQYGKAVYSSENGWKKIKDWFSYAKTLPTLKDELETLPKPKDMEKSVYVLHMPPSGCGLDICQDGQRVGSKAVYDFIAKHQPLFTLHGHIHESPDLSKNWVHHINNTITIQPGQSQLNENFLVYVLLDLKEMTYERNRDLK